ncbi:glycosyltransferase family 4 protein [Paenibacillus sp. GCM10027628]|uniref:glycosyltransferase family 4 protein n=1 Tax=Paenibacillus sp. GCM10027628 TaxID=3273413 RepID=UPI00363B6AB3
MKIVVDLTIVRSANKITGIERVALESMKHMVTDREFMSEHRLTLLCSKTGKSVVEAYLGLETNQQEVALYCSPFKNRILTDQFWMPAILMKIKPDYVYYTTLGLPFLQFYKYSMIFHDAVAWAIPETMSKGMKYYYKPLLERASHHRKLDKVITVSQFSKNEISEYLRVPKEKIHVNYLGIADVFDQAANEQLTNESILNKYGITKKYLISIGTLEPRKNLKGLVQAFKLIKEKYGFEGQLVLVGRKGWIQELHIPASLMQDIILTGFVSDSELPVLLQGSEAFVFPSYYEGFGLPLIEAMSLGVPIISSNRGSLPEIGGEACYYFDPYDANNMSRIINDVLCDTGLREEMSEQGRRRASEFTWREHSNRLIRILSN